MRSHFVPDNFIVTDELRSWAKTTFRIDDKEVDRQTEEWRDFEYKRAYTDWTRCWRRWFRQAEKYATLKREHKPRGIEVISDETKKSDAAKAIAQMAEYRDRAKRG